MHALTKHIKKASKQATLLLSALVMVYGGGMAAAQSITTNDVKDINNATPWYDPNFGGCTTGSGVDTTLVGNDNIEKAYNFFVTKGLKNFQSAGIIGNLMQESGVNPKSNQSGGPGRGIAQWSEGGRWEQLKKFVSNPDNFDDGKTREAESLEGQLAFLWHEMEKVAPWNETLPAIKGTQTVEQATEVFENKFEKAGIPNMPNRIKYARQVLDKYGGGIAATNPTTGEAVSDCPASSGGNSQFLDGFTVYNQCDPAWANKPYSSSTICPSGCGPAAMAMIITALTGQRVTPPETANYAASQGMYIPGVGSSWSIGTVLAKHWGLKSKFIGGSASKINETLKNGGLVIAAGRGALPYTSGGHFIVIRGVTADGKWKVGDSGHRNTSDKDWDPAGILANTSDGSVYAITK
jgi:hypothetical protein